MRSRRLAKNAAEYSSGGRKITSTSSGSSSTSGQARARSPCTSPPSTSRIGYGTPIARLAAASTETATSREIRTSSTPCTQLTASKRITPPVSCSATSPRSSSRSTWPEHLAEREVGLRDGDVAPQRLRDLVRGQRLLGEQAVDLARAALVHREALVDQRRVVGERVAVAGQDLRDLHLARLAHRREVGQQRARAPVARLAGLAAELARDQRVGGDVA